MGKLKKGGVNEKAEEAKQSKDAKKAAHKAASETASEDAEWAAAGEGKQSKGDRPFAPLPLFPASILPEHQTRALPPVERLLAYCAMHGARRHSMLHAGMPAACRRGSDAEPVVVQPSKRRRRMQPRRPRRRHGRRKPRSWRPRRRKR